MLFLSCWLECKLFEKEQSLTLLCTPCSNQMREHILYSTWLSIIQVCFKWRNTQIRFSSKDSHTLLIIRNNKLIFKNTDHRKVSLTALFRTSWDKAEAMNTSPGLLLTHNSAKQSGLSSGLYKLHYFLHNCHAIFSKRSVFSLGQTKLFCRCLNSIRDITWGINK